MPLLIGGCPNNTGSGASGTGSLLDGTGSTGSGSSNGTSTGGTSTSGSTTTTTDANRILELVNTERTSRGFTALARNDQLDDAAVAQATDMRDNKFFDHTGSDGSNVGTRATAAGYTWSAIGENIGSGSVSPEAMMDLWMNSDGHRANILSPNFTELGVGIDERGTALWVQVFGRPQS